MGSANHLDGKDPVRVDEMVQCWHRLFPAWAMRRDDVAVERPVLVVDHALCGLDAGPAHPEAEHLSAKVFRECDVFAVPMPEIDRVAVGLRLGMFPVEQVHPPVTGGISPSDWYADPATPQRKRRPLSSMGPRHSPSSCSGAAPRPSGLRWVDHSSQRCVRRRTMSPAVWLGTSADAGGRGRSGDALLPGWPPRDVQ